MSIPQGDGGLGKKFGIATWGIANWQECISNEVKSCCSGTKLNTTGRSMLKLLSHVLVEYVLTCTPLRVFFFFSCYIS